MSSTVTDQMNRQVSIPSPPKRIISLVPSQTELLCYLGLEKELLGLTKFCIHPPDAKTNRTIIGGTKNLHLDKIADLQPDLIIGNKEENQKEQVEELMEQYPVWMSDISNLEEALQMITDVGVICDRVEKSKQLVADIKQRFDKLSEITHFQTAAYLIWRKPYMVATSGTYIDDLLQRSGFNNVFKTDTRYPEKTALELAAAKPQVILLSSEPYPFKEKHIAELQNICPQAAIHLVDGELFSWYGNRLLHSASYFAKLQEEIAKS